MILRSPTFPVSPSKNFCLWSFRYKRSPLERTKEKPNSPDVPGHLLEVVAGFAPATSAFLPRCPSAARVAAPPRMLPRPLRRPLHQLPLDLCHLLPRNERQEEEIYSFALYLQCLERSVHRHLLTECRPSTEHWNLLFNQILMSFLLV